MRKPRESRVETLSHDYKSDRERLEKILDRRADLSTIRRLEDVLPQLSAPATRLRAPNAECMANFSARNAAQIIEDDFQGGSNVD